MNQSLFKPMPYDTLRDFVPIAHVLDAEGLLVVNPSVNAKTTPQSFAAFQRAGADKWARAIREANVKVE